MFDYESNASSYTITVQAKDEYNASVEGNFTVTVLEVYEPFTNVATEAGITTSGTGAWGDFDNDGDVDLFVSSKLYGNEGNGTFTASSQEFSGGSAIWVDVDNDGDLDLYTHANSNGNAKMYINNAGNWSEQSSALGITPGGESASVG